MTLEEAKKEIKRLADCQLSKFDKNPNQQAWRKARAYENAYDILDEIDTEPVGDPGKLTLKELARELRKIFKFRYLTVSPYREEVLLWWDKPESDGFYWWATETCTQVAFYSDVLSIPINLSEYKDENGKLDYSLCIIDMEDEMPQEER